MKKPLIAMTAIALLVAGCSTQVNYGDPAAVETTTAEFGSTDLQKIAADMVDSMLSSGAVAQITQGSRPIVFVDSVKNKTSEHIDTESITDTISVKLMNSGKFRFVDMNKVETVREQLDFQNNDELVDQSTAIRFGQMLGAQYMIYGNLSSIVKQAGSDKDVYYKMTLRLMDLKTGIIEWADEVEIRKQESKSLFGL